MPITINWVNRNNDFDGVRVYRSTTPFAVNALPTPIATVPPGTNQYVDNDAVLHQLYYYRFGVFKGTDEMVSNQRALSNTPYTGPGPSAIRLGDWDRGFFGEIPNSEMFTASALSTLLGFTAGTVGNDTTPWLKFAERGKVLFTPRGALRYNVSWENIYQAGLVYGVDDPGLHPSPSTSPVNQLRKVVKGDAEFIVRLFRGSNDPTALFVAGEDLSQSSFSRLLHPSTMDLTVTRDFPAWADYGTVQILTDITSNYGNTNWVQELGTATTARRTRGNTSGPQVTGSAGVTALSTSYGWRPVLELVT
jgi:hypothetical protein